MNIFEQLELEYKKMKQIYQNVIFPFFKWNANFSKYCTSLQVKLSRPDGCDAARGDEI